MLFKLVPQKSAASVEVKGSVAHPVASEEFDILPESDGKEEHIAPVAVKPGFVRTQPLKLGPKSGKASLPPMLSATTRVRHVFRFRCNATISGVSITLGNILGSLGGICTVGNNTVTGWASSVRLMGFTAWLPALVAAQSNCFFDWASNLGGYVPDLSKITTIPDGVSVTDALVFRPPKSSLASDWLNPSALSASTSVLGITCPTGTIIDMDAMFTLQNVYAGASFPIAAGTLATAYYLALDGTTTNKIRPLGVPTTA